ncbi:MAG: HipA domain-containing protein [Bacteroidia bacterium]
MNKRCLYCYQKLDSTATGDFHASCSEAFFGQTEAPAFPYSYEQMSKLAERVVSRSIVVPGVQPKLSLSLVNDVLKKNKSSRLTIVGALGGNYILKPPSEHYPEMPQNEHLTMRMAEAFGLRTVKSSLIRLKSGELSYITKRIDRTETGEKIHMLDMCQIVEAFDKYKCSMERIGKAIGKYSDDTLFDQLYFFELSVFSFLTGNNDMHLKNFSMINMANKWVLAPAYDLLNVSIANPADKEELALTLEGKKKKLKRENFEKLGYDLELNKKQIESVFKRFATKKDVALAWIDHSFLSKKQKEKYKMLLEKRYAILQGNS